MVTITLQNTVNFAKSFTGFGKQPLYMGPMSQVDCPPERFLDHAVDIEKLGAKGRPPVESGLRIILTDPASGQSGEATAAQVLDGMHKGMFGPEAQVAIDKADKAAAALAASEAEAAKERAAMQRQQAALAGA